MEYMNLEIEEKLLKCLFFDKECLIKTMNSGVLPKEVFSDKSLRFLYNTVFTHFSKNGSLPSISLLKSVVNRVAERSKNATAFRDKLYSVVDRIFVKKPDQKSKDNFDAYKNELLILMKARVMQEYQMELFEALDTSDIEHAEHLVQNFRLPTYSDDVDSSEFTENARQRIEIVVEQKKNPEKYSLLSTGIPQLDASLGGGIAREFCLIGGSSNAGKSFFLQHMARHNYMKGLNIALFTIEMRKIQVQNRIDCAIAGIDYGLFRNPAHNWSDDDFKKWIAKLKKAKKKYGKLETIAFRKNCTMDSIEAKCYELMNKWQEPLHGIFIDYLDDITPRDNSRGNRDWTSFGEISWDMHNMAQYFHSFDGMEGVPVISANQLKKANKEFSMKGGKDQRPLDERDTGSSPLPYRHSDIYLGIKTDEVDVLSIIQVMKGRSVSKLAQVKAFHNFPMGRFHDLDKEFEYNEAQEAEDKEEVEKIRKINEDDFEVEVEG